MAIDVKFEGIDSWHRPVYKAVVKVNNKYRRYGSCDRLMPSKAIAPNNTTEETNDYFRKNISELCYFGNQFDCEPMGTTPIDNLNIID